MENVKHQMKLDYHQRHRYTDKCDIHYIIIESGVHEHVISDIRLLQTNMIVDEVQLDYADGNTVVLK